ncbi:phosphatidylinositol-4-phosphate 5-kinase-like protein [Leishmania infantum JPCM5]|uniref:Phosphatidylinositol-4-phosphate_5-kinase-like_protein n=2 Tax=Leishmania infantum TaxID=5671 RepID=A0A6L0XRF6_LEIIN|nr:phosphatidylinositol-4-phosphate 5-kinase-like protein [Leishmania infantum JPCM5]CAC9548743.1 phosphatidylinositol-4-phosphate_5-kinase-like_protein [Leishmania infantum]CAM72678.1 phosphatidylinositol-4-phosphate 5-kinase-like protein [Leishmania infantum JPCM5]SUZ46409.1 phosphatidylinositol-4-phosphate_5-kinase-like_protein [Leishmania infantum]|eukprot:XP_001469569.1 phosphatidylinositol-4-phosphate 5-kinase-like protein [Leishmania infantum JPCM5]
MGQVGGTATSGRGLTALQVAAALRVTAAARLKKAEAATLSSQAMHSTHCSLAEQSKAIKPEDCSAVQQLTVPSTDHKGKHVKVRVTEYAPEVFSFLRQLKGVTDPQFADEWSLPENRLKMEMGEGRSQAFFLKSKTMLFMCKTISVEEVRALLRVLRAYTLHITAHPSSLLMRFYMLLKVSVRNEEGYILCFNDVFGAASVLHEKWDIKGRVPKNGKHLHYPHLIRSGYEPDPHVTKTRKNPHVLANPAIDASQQHPGRESAVVVRGTEGAQGLPTLHDKDLTRLFWAPRTARKRLVEELLRDYDFLKNAGMMDYSLLIGVAYQDDKTRPPEKRYGIENTNVASSSGVAPVSTSAEVRPATLAQDNHPFGTRTTLTTFPEFANGVRSFDDQEVYYIGVIDVLTTYTLKKKGANFFKSLLWKQKTLSTIPPDRYAHRITSFTELIFPDVKEEANGG